MTDRAYYTVIYRGDSEAEVLRRYVEHAGRMAERGIEPVSEQRSRTARETVIAVTYQHVRAAVEAATPLAAVPVPGKVRRPTRGPW